jgi:alpha-galactosidase
MEFHKRSNFLKGCISLCYVGLLFVFSFSARGQQTKCDSIPEMDTRKWVNEYFAKGKTPPFSFIYGGKSSDHFIRSWQFSSERKKTDDSNVEEFVFTYSDKQSGLVVKCFVSCFLDYPAVEWVLKFSNQSGTNTPLVEDAAVVDLSLSFNKKITAILHHSNGSNASPGDFMPFDDTLRIGESIRMSPA